jgi:(2Fe-2S) ferredoxin
MRLFRLLHLILLPPLANGLQTTVQVCTNKDCCKRFQGKSMTLVQAFYDLVPPAALKDITIEPSGCLSNCGKGPNICIQTEGQDDKIVYGIANAASAAAELDLSDALVTHPTLLAAVNVMEKAELGESVLTCAHLVLYGCLF